MSRYIGLPGSDREFPALTGRSGTQRARALLLPILLDSFHSSGMAETNK